MAEQEGFLARLTGSPIREETIARDRIRQAIANPSAGNAGLRQMMFGLGQQAAGGLGATALGVKEGLFGKKEGESFLSATNRGAQEAQDKLTAAAVGIDPTELQTRRRIRSELAQANVSGSPESRLKFAQRAAQIAADAGDSASLGRALTVIQNLKTEQEEFNKLQAQTRQEEFEADTQGITDIWMTGDTQARTAQITPEGAVITNDKGETETIPFGQFSTTDPRRGGAFEPFDQRYRKLVPSSARQKISASVTAAKGGLRQMQRALSSLRDWAKAGDAGIPLHTSGKALTFVDNTVRNIQGFARAWIDNKQDKGRYERPDGTKVTPDQEFKSFLSRASEIDIALPKGVVRGSAAAQNWNAQIMSLAYAAARMEEPSNRGLSDNDIQNALKRLTASGSNPQAIFRRFSEMIGDSAIAIDDEIGSWYGPFKDDMSEEEFRSRLGGTTLDRYKAEFKEFMGEFGVSYDKFGRAVHKDSLDEDVAPGESVRGNNGEVPLEELPDDDFLKATLGEQETN